MEATAGIAAASAGAGLEKETIKNSAMLGIAAVEGIATGRLAIAEEGQITATAATAAVDTPRTVRSALAFARVEAGSPSVCRKEKLTAIVAVGQMATTRRRGRQLSPSF